MAHFFISDTFYWIFYAIIILIGLFTLLRQKYFALMQ